MTSTEKRHDLIQIAKGLRNVPWCEDYEKMISGMLYNAVTPELIAGRHRAHKWCHKYNSHFPQDSTPESLEADRRKMLLEILGGVGENAYVENPVYMDYGCNIRVGKNFYSNFNLVVLDCSLVLIGDNVKFGPSVSIFGAGHLTEPQSRRDLVEFAEAVIIGSDCWIGGNTTILPGITIGQGCTVGAGSVVTRDIPAWSVAIGSPARVVKKVTPLEDSENKVGEIPVSGTEEMASKIV